ncbi:MAG: hypothetical protein G01um1014106_120 [Parcubacteria group bacterium Gr01-1014_106]|nr:MAG: hypothetical protein G01um1014106_120 [Parcubacteria group bacterium Gr01-1014_106]
MTRNILLPLIVFLALAACEAAFARWLPAPVHIPLLLPTAIAVALYAPLHRLLRLAFLSALAGEMVSGAPAGVLSIALIAVAVLTRAVIRRPELPAFVHGCIGAGAAIAYVCILSGFVSGWTLPPARLMPAFLAVNIAIPALSTGILVGCMSALMAAFHQRHLRPFGFSPGIVIQRLPSA